MCHLLTNSRAAADAVLGDSLGMPLTNDMSDGGGPLRGRAKINVTCRFRIDGRSDRFISLFDDPKQSSGRSPMLSVRACLVCVCVGVQCPAMCGSCDLIELNGDELSPQPAQRTRGERCRVRPRPRRFKLSPGLASVRRRGPDLDRTIVHKRPKESYQLKGAYRVSLRHSFNRRHYRHGTC